MESGASKFTNTAYEYATREYPYDPATRQAGRWDGDKEMFEAGWRIAWATINHGGHFVVYEREKK